MSIVVIQNEISSRTYHTLKAGESLKIELNKYSIQETNSIFKRHEFLLTSPQTSFTVIVDGVEIEKVTYTPPNI